MEQPRILIVDDEQDLCTLIQRALEKEGFHEIRTAHTLKDGLAVFETFRPHLAILDVMLPDGEGLSALPTDAGAVQYPDPLPICQIGRSR